MSTQFFGGTIRIALFFFLCLIAIGVLSIVTLMGSPIYLLSKICSLFQITCTPLQTVAFCIQVVVKEMFAILALIAFSPIDLEELDPLQEECIPKMTSVLLVHGFLGSSSNWLVVRDRLNKAGIRNLFSLNLGDPRLSIEDYTELLEKKVRKIQSITGCSQVILVGHSMGGLVCTNYAHNDQQSVQKIVAIGTPFKGTKTAYFGAFFSKAAVEMIPGSAFLEKLADFNVPRLQIASSSDEIILPNSSAQGSDEKDSIIDDVGHIGLLLSRKIAQTIVLAIGHQRIDL